VDIQAKEDDYDLFSDEPRGEIHDHPGYAAMLLHLDGGIGKILDSSSTVNSRPQNL
jgi:hypothetical protein